MIIVKVAFYGRNEGNKYQKRLEVEQPRRNQADPGRQSSPQTMGTTIGRLWWSLIMLVDQILSRCFSWIFLACGAGHS